MLGVMFGIAVFCAKGADVFNQDGRDLSLYPMPNFTSAVLFDTPQADAIVAAMQIFPVAHGMNERVTMQPAVSNSAAMIAQMDSDLGAGALARLHPLYDMNFVIVPQGQPLVDITFTAYPDQSDVQPPALSADGTVDLFNYPVPSNMITEGWPYQYPGQTIAQNQTTDDGSDRHGLIVDPLNADGNSYTWETWRTVLGSDTPWTGWTACNGAQFNLTTGAPRPAGWTSGDAGGLSIFAGTVRYDECERGQVEHAVRLIVKHTQGGYLYPATHEINQSSNTNEPKMGQRLRLPASFVVPTTWSKESQALCYALKKYGGIITDLGSIFSFSNAPDSRWTGNEFSDIENNLTINSFEVVQPTTATTGPRTASPAPPTASAGSNQNISSYTTTLNGSATGTNVVTQWYLYPNGFGYTQPGTANIGNPSALSTTVTFSAQGVYLLVLSADDNLHAVAYSGVYVTVNTTGAYTVSGTIDLGGSPLAGVTVSDGTNSVTTNAYGNYSLTEAGAYTLTPSLAGYTFSPATQTGTISGASVSGANFMATVVVGTYTVSGTITASGGSPLAGVTVSDGTNSVTTNASGNYSLTEAGAYTLTPSLAGYTFSPATQTGTLSGASVTGANFTATAVVGTYTVSGTITASGGSPLAGVTVSNGTNSAESNSSGIYNITGVPDGTYTLTPSLAGYTFSPASQTVTVAGANVSQNFTALSRVATPAFSPAAGAYAGAQTVTLSCATSGAAIYYTTDGSTPAASSTKYTAPISISASTQLQALAVEAGMANSMVCSGVYNIASSGTFVSNTETDTDGNGFPDELKTALGVSLTNSSATPLGMPAGTAPLPLTLSKLEVKLNFTHAGSDTISLKGTLPIPAGWVLPGQQAVIEVGGVVKNFTPNSKGKWAAYNASGYTAVTSSTNDHFSLKYKSKKGAVAALETGSFTAQFNKGAFASLLASEGLLGTANVKKTARTVPVIILFNMQMFEAAQAVQYTATANKAGLAINK
jgi:hypothetical protein